MTEDKTGATISFGGNVGKVNLNTGDGTQVTGDGANVQVGDGNTQNITQTLGGSLDLAALLAALKSAAGDSESGDQSVAVELSEAVAPIEQMAQESADSPEATPEPSRVEKALEGFKNFATGPNGAKVGKALLKAALSFGKASLSAHPVGAGILAALESFDADSAAQAAPDSDSME